ncbi:MAG TPA: hypothetical protein IAC41_02710, partial [Candidatus Merdenecus merdavium]|nr:hypothetical protein [Candidatus Merdenecus merdavium]
SRAFVAVFCLAFVFWLGYSIYLSVHGPIRSRTTVNAESITDYLATLYETEVIIDGDVEDTTQETEQIEEAKESEDQSETEVQTETESKAEE